MGYSFTYSEAASAIVKAYTTVIGNFNSDTSGIDAHGTDSPAVYNVYSITYDTTDPVWPLATPTGRVYYFTVNRSDSNYSGAQVYSDFTSYLTSSGFFTTYPAAQAATTEGVMELLSLMSRFLICRTRFWYDYFSVSGLATSLFYDGSATVNAGSLYNNDAWISPESLDMITDPLDTGSNPTLLTLPSLRIKRTPVFNSCSCSSSSSSSAFLLYVKI